MTKDQLITSLERELGFRFKRCTSSRLMGYAWKDNILYIIFGGTVKRASLYKYPSITKEQFKSLECSKSKGSWVQQNLVNPKVKYEGFDINI